MNASGPALVIGYGNVLRGDDGAGPAVAEAVARSARAETRAFVLHQLVPELAEELARARLAIFVDACHAGPNHDMRVEALAPANDVQPLGHTATPGNVLAHAQVLFGAYPPSWHVLVPGVSFKVGDGLSQTALAGIETALHAIDVILAGVCPPAIQAVCR